MPFVDRHRIEEEEEEAYLKGFDPPRLRTPTKGETFVPYVDLFNSISNLSYAGDPRMTAGAEDPRKVEKLVTSEGQGERFQELYRVAFETLEERGAMGRCEGGVVFHGDDSKARLAILNFLPTRLRDDPRNAIASNLGGAVARIVGRSAWGQSVKGGFTAGVWKSGVYLAAKFKKGRG